MQYKCIRRCRCGNEDVLEMTKLEATFGNLQEKFSKIKCSRCGKLDIIFQSLPLVKLDENLLLKWANNSEYYLMEQDEELLLADEEYLDFILDILDNHTILEHKRKVLLEALCIMLYDCIFEKSEEKKIIDRLIVEMIKRKKDIIATSDYIRDYIKEKVFPILEIVDKENKST